MSEKTKKMFVIYIFMFCIKKIVSLQKVFYNNKFCIILKNNGIS